MTVSQDLACHTTADAGATVSLSQRCPRAQGLLRCLGGESPVTFPEGAQGLLSPFVFVYSGYRYITQGCAGGALSTALVGWWWHHSRRTSDCSRVLTACIQATSLKETWGLLSRFDCVYSDYITQGCPGGALAVAMSLRARCFFFPTHVRAEYLRQQRLARSRRIAAFAVVDDAASRTLCQIAKDRGICVGE